METRWTVGELMDADFPPEYVNFPRGKSHLFDGRHTACGLDLEVCVNYSLGAEPERPLCLVCSSSRDGFFQALLEAY